MPERNKRISIRNPKHLSTGTFTQQKSIYNQFKFRILEKKDNIKQRKNL